MRPISHPASVPYLLQQAIARGATNWNTFGGKSMVTASLESLQKGLCAYCQIRLDSGIGSHIEHIVPKGVYPTKTFRWKNLVLSCTHSHQLKLVQGSGGVSCGHSHGKREWLKYNKKFIIPTSKNCERYFEYRASDGEVRASEGLTPGQTVRANYTIETLNLNCSRLRRERKDMLEQGYRIVKELISDSTALSHFIDLELAEIGGKLPSFFTARQQHFECFL